MYTHRPRTNRDIAAKTTAQAVFFIRRFNMKEVAAILALSLATAAQAGPYQNAEARQDYCSNLGGMAGVVFQGKQEGKPKQRYLDLAAKQLAENDKNAELVRFAIDYAYDEASDRKGAHMKVWAYCMDTTR